MDNKAVINATIAAKSEWWKLTGIICFSLIKLIKDNAIDARIIGIESNIENLAELSLS